MTKVVLRKFKQGGEIIALFPEALWNPQDYSIASYMHVGQHGAADYDHVISMTTPINEPESTDLLTELRSIGYDDLRVMQRCRPNFVNKNQIKI